MFVAFGEEATPTLQYAQDRLEHFVVRPLQGHDGKFFFVQANDPLLLDPSHNAAVLDRPIYRSHRMLYPTVASLGGLLGPHAILWGLVLANVLAFGLGGGLVGRYAQRLGLSPWLGLAFPLNPGLISELAIDGAGVLAFALVMGAALALLNQKFPLAITFFALACLTREVMLLAAAGGAVWLWKSGRRATAGATVAAPAATMALWAMIVRLRIPNGKLVAGVQELGIPLRGVVEAVPRWLQDPLHLLVGVFTIVALLLMARQMAHGRPDPLGFISAGFAVLALVLTVQVWTASFDFTRALAPVWTALVVSPSGRKLRNAATLDRHRE